eukprot:5312037-Pleurochrysis_carterae.AAC.1
MHAVRLQDLLYQSSYKTLEFDSGSTTWVTVDMGKNAPRGSCPSTSEANEADEKVLQQFGINPK